MIVDLKNSKQTQTIIKTREDIFKERYDMYHDDFRRQVEHRLEEIYVNARILRLDKQIDCTNNIYKTIVNKISKVYSYGVERDFSNDADAQVYKTMGINKIMKQANRYTNAFNDMLIQVVAMDGIPKLIFRYPHKTKVVLSDSGDVQEVEYFVGYVEAKEKWAYWSATEHYYKIYTLTKTEYHIESIEGNENNANPYSVMPFVYLQNGFRDTNFFDSHTGQDLVNITLDTAVYSTFKNYMIKWQSFKQLALLSRSMSSINGQALDPAQPLMIQGEDVELQLLDLQANLTQLHSVIQAQSEIVAVNYNISPSQFRMTSQVSSGYALQMENKALDEFVVQQQDDFIKYEQQLFKLMKAIVPNSVVGELNGVIFKPPSYSEAPNVKIDTQIKKVELGTVSPVEIIAIERDVDLERAEEIYSKNIQDRNRANERLNTNSFTVDLPQ